jgi:EAL domain-containing protein (putative c-di-GMP-specific phosphodiesterase class I)
MGDGTEKRAKLLKSWFALHESARDDASLRKTLYDPVTGMPTSPQLLPRIESLLAEHGEAALVAVDLSMRARMEEIFGWEVVDETLRELARSLDRVTGRDLRDNDIMAALAVGSSTFVIVLSPPRMTEHVSMDNLELVARRIESCLRVELRTALGPAVFSKLRCHVGSSVISPPAKKEDLVSTVLGAIGEALSDADTRAAAEAVERVSGLQAIISAGALRTLVHPIRRLDDMSVIGYEVLARGPEGGEFEYPDKLFGTAYDTGLVAELEQLCWERAFALIEKLPEGRALFVNMEVDSVGNPALQALARPVDATGIDPSRIVIELSEREALPDFGEFRSAAAYVRALGLHLAIDDAGTGPGLLRRIMSTHPEWLKLDRSLTSGVDNDPMRFAYVTDVARLARAGGTKLVAVGIERQEQLDALRQAGVEYGQGFLFGRPTEPFPTDELNGATT